MVFIGVNTAANKSEVVEAYTNATLDSLEKSLNDFGYTVHRSAISITATIKGNFRNNAHGSTVIIIDQNGVRYCKDTETSVGLLCNPNVDRLAEIIIKAEQEQVS